MKTICLLVEGKTEKIFFEKLLPWIQTPDRLFVSQKLTEILDDTRENKIWINNVSGDRSFVTYIKKRKNVFLQNTFDELVLIRDYAPDDRPPVSLCKKDLCAELLENIPQEVLEKYANKTFINLSVREIEAWFFIDKEMFEKLDEKLTEDYINQKYDNILNRDPEEISKPVSKLKKILSQETGFEYRKHEKDIYKIVTRINLDNCYGVINDSYGQSLNRIVQFLKCTLVENDGSSPENRLTW